MKKDRRPDAGKRTDNKLKILGAVRALLEKEFVLQQEIPAENVAENIPHALPVR